MRSASPATVGLANKDLDRQRGLERSVAGEREPASQQASGPQARRNRRGCPACRFSAPRQRPPPRGARVAVRGVVLSIDDWLLSDRRARSDPTPGPGLCDVSFPVATKRNLINNDDLLRHLEARQPRGQQSREFAEPAVRGLAWLGARPRRRPSRRAPHGEFQRRPPAATAGCSSNTCSTSRGDDLFTAAIDDLLQADP